MNLPHRETGAMFLGKAKNILQIAITIRHHSQLTPALWWLLHETALLLGTEVANLQCNQVDGTGFTTSENRLSEVSLI